jgi:uncharacterized protein YajQ (UPF0234 family)
MLERGVLIGACKRRNEMQMNAYTNPQAEGKADELIKAIKAHIAKGDQLKDKSEQHYISAGLHLNTLKADGAHKRHGLTWEQYVKDKCGISRERADQLIRIADGRTTVEQGRASTTQRVTKHRDEKAVLRNTGSVHVDELQRLWDAAPAEAKQGFVEANVAELGDLLAQQRKRAVLAAADRAAERTMLSPSELTIPNCRPSSIARCTDGHALRHRGWARVRSTNQLQ